MVMYYLMLTVYKIFLCLFIAVFCFFCLTLYGLENLFYIPSFMPYMDTNQTAF